MKAQPYVDESSLRVAFSTYRRLAEGTPAPVEDVAERAGESVGLAEQLLASWPGVVRDDRGRIVGFWGLTIGKLVPTHAIELEGRRLFAWCAWDTLFLPGILGPRRGSSEGVGKSDQSCGHAVVLVDQGADHRGPMDPLERNERR